MTPVPPARTTRCDFCEAPLTAEQQKRGARFCSSKHRSAHWRKVASIQPPAVDTTRDWTDQDWRAARRRILDSPKAMRALMKEYRLTLDDSTKTDRRWALINAEVLAAAKQICQR